MSLDLHADTEQQIQLANQWAQWLREGLPAAIPALVAVGGDLQAKSASAPSRAAFLWPRSPLGSDVILHGGIVATALRPKLGQLVARPEVHVILGCYAPLSALTGLALRAALMEQLPQNLREILQRSDATLQGDLARGVTTLYLIDEPPPTLVVRPSPRVRSA